MAFNVTLASVRSLAALRKANLAYKDTSKVPTIDAKDGLRRLKRIYVLV
jgi:hypothetical protein